MKIFRILMFLFVFFTGFTLVYADSSHDVISMYKGSKMIFDDNRGFQTFYYLSAKDVMKTIDGKMRRKFCSAPKGVSPYELIKNYEAAIKSKGGEVIHFSREAYRHRSKVTKEWVYFISNFFTKNRENRMNHWGYMELPRHAEDYVVGKLNSGGNDIYISVAAALIENLTYYTIVTVVAKPMDMNNVTLNVLNEGIARNGKVAIYDIYFDTGKFKLKKTSSGALKIIADYLKKNTKKKFLIVGHTDTEGGFESNIKLSNSRALAVMDELIKKYGISRTQLKAYGAGPSCPVASNELEPGRARNRRVELVEL